MRQCEGLAKINELALWFAQVDQAETTWRWLRLDSDIAAVSDILSRLVGCRNIFSSDTFLADFV